MIIIIYYYTINNTENGKNKFFELDNIKVSAGFQVLCLLYNK